jgi:hypothetical protein
MTFLLKIGGVTYTTLKKTSTVLAIAIGVAYTIIKMRPYL